MALQFEVLRTSVVTERDIVRARDAVRRVSKQIGLGLVDETKIVTAASELGRNLVFHARDGEIHVWIEEGDGGAGVHVRSQDGGPGILDIDQALTDGFSTGGSLGVGLPGTRRIVDEFHIESSPAGTIIDVVKWRR